MESVPDTPLHESVADAITTTATMIHLSSLKEEEEEEEDEAFIPPPSTAPAAMTQLRAGRKRALTMKALKAEKASKRGAGQGRGRGRGRARREAQG